MIWKSNFKLFILLLMLTCWFDFSVVHVNLSLLIWLIWHFIKLRNCWGVYLLISNIGSVNQVFFLLIYCFHSIISLYLLNKEKWSAISPRLIYLFIWQSIRLSAGNPDGKYFWKISIWTASCILLRKEISCMVHS